jgi:hypothetical protein
MTMCDGMSWTTAAEYRHTASDVGRRSAIRLARMMMLCLRSSERCGRTGSTMPQWIMMSQCARRGAGGIADKCLDEDKREIARDITRSIAGRFAAAEAVKDDKVRGSAAAATGEAMP